MAKCHPVDATGGTVLVEKNESKTTRQDVTLYMPPAEQVSSKKTKT